MAITRPERYRRRHTPTLADAVDRLLSMDEINPNEPRAINRAIAAVKSATNSFVSYAPMGFKYYNARKRIDVGGAITLGDITVSSGVVTDDGGFTSWPTWMQTAHCRFGNQSYPVTAYDGSGFTIADPPADGSYTGATLEHMVIELPPDFKARGSITDKDDYYPVLEVPAGTLQSWQDYWDWARSAAQPRIFGAITGDERFSDSLYLGIWPPFETDKVLNLFYERYPEVPEVHRVGTGNITVSGTTATSASSVFTSDHVGSTIVFCTSSDADFTNSLADPSTVLAQRTITGYTSGTVVTLDSAVTGASAVTFYISDPLDVQPGAMEEAFYRLCEYEMIRQSRGQSNRVATRFNEFMSQYRLAMADDARYKDSIDDGAYLRNDGYGIGDVTSRPS